MIQPTAPMMQGMPPIAVDCACCGARLNERLDHCPTCEAPVSLSHTVAMRSGPQNFVSVLGASNAGKTVFLGLLLDILSKGPEEFRGMATSAFSVDLQEHVVTALEKRSFPEKTPNEADSWNWLHCQVSTNEKKGNRDVDLISPDFAGEAIAMEVNQAGMYPAIQSIVSKSSGILLLCDSMRVRDEGSAEDLFGMKLASYIAQQHELSSERGRSRSGGPALAIVFTKCDGCPEAQEDPTSFAANNTPRLFEFCRRTFSNHSFFAASVAGSSGILSDESGCQQRIPFYVQPQGILEPLRWIVAHMS